MRRALLMRDETAVFCVGHLGQVTAERGVGKTWFLETLALIAASGDQALGFRAPQPCRVLLTDGEMASTEIQERFALLRERLQITHRGVPLTIVAADWQGAFLPRLDWAARVAIPSLKM